MYTPYIGITDFPSFWEVQLMQREFALYNFYKSISIDHVLHVGVMMSRKTLYGIETKWADVFPPKEKISEIFSSPETFNCLHYADYDYDPNVEESLKAAISYGGMGMDAIQLDMHWPEPGDIAGAVHASRRNIEVILQIGKKALEETDGNPDIVTEKLKEYEGVVDRVLFDKSMGKGKELDAQFLLPFLRQTSEVFPQLGLGVAGGLGPETLHLLAPILQEFPQISIDAQGKLRTSGSALDPVEWDIAADYLRKALQLIGSYT